MDHTCTRAQMLGRELEEGKLSAGLLAPLESCPMGGAELVARHCCPRFLLAPPSSLGARYKCWAGLARPLGVARMLTSLLVL